MLNRIEEHSTKFKNNDVLYYCARNRKEKREMKTKIFGVVFIAVLLFSALGTVYMPTSNAKTLLGPIADNDPYPINDMPGLEGKTVSWAQPDTGNTWTVLVSDDYLGGFYYLDFECIVEADTCNVWVGLSPDQWWDPTDTVEYHDERVLNDEGVEDDVFYFAYNWSWNAHIVSYRYLDGYRDYVTGAQLQAVADEFDSKIGDTCVNFFGDYDHSRLGPLGDGKIQILVFNIRDEFFYSPLTAPGFIMGYYWYTVSQLNNANIIHIDTWQWYRRQGPTPDGGVGCPYIAVPYSGTDLRPNQYEGTIAHEFQHLIHRDNDFDEMSWPNEGCSTLAEFICGYGHTTNLLNYMQYFWDTSLVFWEGYLENYGVVYLWTLYMYEHYGGQPLIWDIVHEPANGIQGWNNVLQAHGIKKNFDQIFEDWAIANYLDDTSFANGIYGYYNLDLPCAASGWWSIPYSMAYWQSAYPDFFNWNVHKLEGNPQMGYAYPNGYSRLPYIPNYVKFLDLGTHALRVDFAGDQFVGVFPHSPTHEWHSRGTGFAWYRLKSQTFSIPSAGATLKFWSNYDIEEEYDFGYVEVHDLGTDTEPLDEWYTLEGIGTTTAVNVDGTDNTNCPDEFEPTTYLTAGRWYGFTGNSGGWYQELMSLGQFADHDVEIFFTYWTDPYTLGLGWYIDDIEIPELVFLDDVESGFNDWTTYIIPSGAPGWWITTGVEEMDWTVNLVQRVEPAHVTYVTHMNIDDEYEVGSTLLPMIDTGKVRYDAPLMVITAQPGSEIAFATSYIFLYQKEPWPLTW
jgi:hypothetical protein